MLDGEYRPVPPGRALARVRPAAGLLLRLVPQRGIGEPGVAWSGRTRPAWFDVSHQVLGGVDAGRDLDLSMRTHVVTGDSRSLALAHLVDRRDRDADDAPQAGDPGWAPIRVEVDGAPLPALQGIADGYEIVVLTVGDRLTTIVTGLFDAERFEPRYATFRPWFDQTSEA